jgi:hypothetical protein
VVRAMDPHGRIPGFLERSRCYFFQAALQLYSRGWVDPVPDPPLRKSGSIWNRTRDFWICSQTTEAVNRQSPSNAIYFIEGKNVKLFLCLTN